MNIDDDKSGAPRLKKNRQETILLARWVQVRTKCKKDADALKKQNSDWKEYPGEDDFAGLAGSFASSGSSKSHDGSLSGEPWLCTKGVACADACAKPGAFGGAFAALAFRETVR